MSLQVNKMYNKRTQKAILQSMRCKINMTHFQSL